MKNVLKDFFESVAFAANISTMILNFKSFKIKFPGFSVKEALNETTEIEKIITDLFNRKHVMWEHHQYEDFNWCINSLKDLRNKCDDYSDNFFQRKKSDQDKFHFLASIARIWGSYSDEAYKELINSNLTGKSIETILKNFRKKSYPIVVTFLFSLKDGNPTKVEGFTKLEIGMKNTKISIYQVLQKWSLESI